MSVRVFFVALVAVIFLCLKKPCVASPDVASITLGKEDYFDSFVQSFTYSSLWYTKRTRSYKYSTRKAVPDPGFIIPFLYFKFQLF